MNWETIIAACAAITLAGAAFGFYVRLLLRAFEAELFERLDGRYADSDLCLERHRETERRLNVLEDRS